MGFVLYGFPYGWEGRQVYMEDLYVQPQHRGLGVGTKVTLGYTAEILTVKCSSCGRAWSKTVSTEDVLGVTSR